MMTLGNTGVKMGPDLFLLALKAQMCSAEVNFW